MINNDGSGPAHASPPLASIDDQDPNCPTHGQPPGYREFAALMTNPDVTDPLGEFLYGREVDHEPASSPVEKCKVQDHQPWSGPVFLTDPTSADTSAVRESPFSKRDGFSRGEGRR